MLFTEHHALVRLHDAVVAVVPWALATWESVGHERVVCPPKNFYFYAVSAEVLRTRKI